MIRTRSRKRTSTTDVLAAESPKKRKVTRLSLCSHDKENDLPGFHHILPFSSSSPKVVVNCKAVDEVYIKEIAAICEPANFEDNQEHKDADTIESSQAVRANEQEDIIHRFLPAGFKMRFFSHILQPLKMAYGYVFDVYGSERIPRSSSSTVTLPLFSRFMSSECFICKTADFDTKLRKCQAKGCSTAYHKRCLRAMNFAGYSGFHAITNDAGPSILCPLHHCQKCFADNLHHRCFQFTTLIRCKHCHFSYHPNCIPAGCQIIDENATTCPRHLKLKTVEHPTTHCFECYKDSDDTLIDCSNCLRKFHIKCHSYPFYKPGYKYGERCSTCIRSNFITPGSYCCYFKDEKWYLGKALSFDDSPKALTDEIHTGYFVVQRIDTSDTFDLVSHYNILSWNANIPQTMTISNYTPALDSLLQASLQYQSAPLEHSSRIHYRNRKVTIIDKNKFPPQFKRECINKNKKQYGHSDEDENLQCGCQGSVKCIDEECEYRSLYFECPPSCDIENACQNQLLKAKHKYQKDLEIFHTDGCGFGLRTNVKIPKNAMIGEYCGEVINQDEMNKRQKFTERWGSRDVAFYYMDFDLFYLDAQYYGSIMRYANHSCDPNAVTQRYYDNSYELHICLFAKRDIEAGEEITFAYATKQNANNGTFTCKCSASKCLGTYYA